MSTINPAKHEYETPDGLKVAKDISWVIKTLWGGAAIFVLATVWVVALAQDVKTNTDKISEAATKGQVQQVLEALGDIKGSLNDADERQRDMKSQVDKLTADVETLKEKAE